jgi:hypothetical protein
VDTEGDCLDLPHPLAAPTMNRSTLRWIESVFRDGEEKRRRLGLDLMSRKGSWLDDVIRSIGRDIEERQPPLAPIAAPSPKRLTVKQRRAATAAANKIKREALRLQLKIEATKLLEQNPRWQVKNWPDFHKELPTIPYAVFREVFTTLYGRSKRS